jgi:hypothetical protein
MSRKAHTRDSVKLGVQKIRCGSHGKVPWYGDVVCIKCGAVFMRDGDSYPEAPEDGSCTCGTRLFPDRDDGTGAIRGEFSARVCCRTCAQRKKASS